MRFTLGLIVGIVIAAVLFAIVMIGPMFRTPWVEAVGNSVLRTTAPQATVAAVEYAVADRHRNFVIGADDKPYDPTYSDGGTSWGSGPAPNVKTAEVIRGHLQFMDKDSHQVAIERITSTGLPTHVFIAFDGPQGPQSIVDEMLTEFQKQGVRVK